MLNSWPLKKPLYYILSVHHYAYLPFFRIFSNSVLWKPYHIFAHLSYLFHLMPNILLSPSAIFFLVFHTTLFLCVCMCVYMCPIRLLDLLCLCLSFRSLLLFACFTLSLCFYRCRLLFFFSSFS